MNKKALVIAIAVVLVVVAIGINRYRTSMNSAVNTSTYVAPTNDTPDAITQQLDNIDTGAQLNADFETTDADIKSL